MSHQDFENPIKTLKSYHDAEKFNTNLTHGDSKDRYR